MRRPAAPGGRSTGRAGRRPGKEDTRGQVLAAARAEFAEQGYERTSVRGIARVAEVDPALVHHYFGTKEELFVAAMELPIVPAEFVSSVVVGDADERGERLVRAFLAIWGNPVTRQPLLTMLRAAMTHERAAAMMRGFVSTALLARVAAQLDLPDARLRVELAASHLVGMAFLRYVIKVEPLASVSEDTLVKLIAPSVQRYLVP